MVRPDGLAKVLDFGLAQLTETSSPAVDTDAPTAAAVHTETGARVRHTQVYVARANFCFVPL